MRHVSFAVVLLLVSGSTTVDRLQAGQIGPKGAIKKVALPCATLEVREGAIAKWGSTSTITNDQGKGAGVGHFRWTKPPKGAAAAKYQVSTQPFFANCSHYQASGDLKVNANLALPSSVGAWKSFDIAFKPILAAMGANMQPAATPEQLEKQKQTFYVRVVAVNNKTWPLSPVSNTVIVNIYPPSLHSPFKDPSSR